MKISIKNNVHFLKIICLNIRSSRRNFVFCLSYDFMFTYDSTIFTPIMISSSHSLFSPMHFQHAPSSGGKDEKQSASSPVWATGNAIPARFRCRD